MYETAKASLNERIKAANEWHYMQLGFLIEYMKNTRVRLERFEPLGKEAADLIDTYITNLERLRNDLLIEPLE